LIYNDETIYMLIKKGTKLYSILHFRCPNCHEGTFFKYKRTWNPSKITQIHENCPSCKMKYMIEPAFYYGAMYVAYGLTVGLALMVFVVSTTVFDCTLLQSFSAIIVVLLATAMINLRISRIVWLNLFVKYQSRNTKND
jgi:uncharacterized protein (DUF983 family)